MRLWSRRPTQSLQAVFPLPFCRSRLPSGSQAAFTDAPFGRSFFAGGAWTLIFLSGCAKAGQKVKGVPRVQAQRLPALGRL
jgi:hypothetical protein